MQGTQHHTQPNSSARGRSFKLKRWTSLSTEEKFTAIYRVYRRIKEPSLREVAEHLTEVFGSPITKNMVSSVVARNKTRFDGLPFGTSELSRAPVLREHAVVGDTENFLGHSVPATKNPTGNKGFSAFNLFTGRLAVQRERQAPMNIDLAPCDGEPVPLKLTLQDLEKGQCKWPVSGNHGPTLFCGQPSLAGKPYCACHARRSAPRIAEPDALPESRK